MGHANIALFLHWKYSNVMAKFEAKSKYKYIGSVYQKGILLDSGVTIHPLKMSDKEIENCIKENPSAATLWRKL